MSYKVMYIRKRTGGTRTLEEPDPVLKRIHKSILDKIPKYDFMEYMTGGTFDKSGTHKTAAYHVNQDVILKMDISDFFGSVTPRMAYDAMVKHLNMDKLEAACIADITSVNNRLPQGSPTSPYMANLAAVDMAKDLNSFAESLGCRFSIYVDDFYISGPFSSELHNKIDDIMKIMKKHSFKMKKSKIKIMRRGGKQQIMDVCVAGVPQWSEEEQRYRLPKYKRHVVFCAIHNLENLRPKASLPSIRGLISNMKRVSDPHYNKAKMMFDVAVAKWKEHLQTTPMSIGGLA